MVEDVLFGIGRNGIEVQSIRFSKDKFQTKDDVQNWLDENDFKPIIIESLDGLSSFDTLFSRLF